MNSSDFLALMNTRQSCRSFAEKPLTDEQVMACLEAVRLAPSACNAQPYHIHVCTGECAKEVAPLTQSAGMNGFTSKAPCFFVFAEDDYNASAAAGSRFKNQDYRSIDIGIASAQLVLYAESMGLASCILGWFNEKKLQKLLGTERRIRLIVAVGYAAEGYKLREKKRKDIDKLSSFHREAK